MAGGEGTRLRPLTSNQPKPMAPIVGKPCMQHIIELLRRHGLTDIIVTVAYLPQVIRGYFGDGDELGVQMQYSVEESPLGTAGSVRAAAAMLDETFLVISGDALCDFDLTALIAHHNERGGVATIALKRVENPLEFGVVITDEEGRIERFLEKPSWGQVFSDTINTGVYVLDPSVLRTIPEDEPYDFSKQLFPDLLLRGKPLHGWVSDGYWQDVGTLEQYSLANQDVLDGKTELEIPGIRLRENIYLGDGVQLPELGQIEGPAYLGNFCRLDPGARIEPYSVLGNNVVVKDGATVQRSVVDSGCYIGPGARIEGAVLGKRVDVRGHALVNPGAAVGDECSVGAEAVLQRGVRVYPFKTIEAGAVVHTHLIWESRGLNTLFAQDGVNGLVGVDITPEVAARLGMAYGTTMPARARIVTSRDAHPASRMISRAMMSGLVSTGVDVSNLRVAMPAVARHQLKIDERAGGIHVRISEDDPEVVQVRFFEAPGIVASEATLKTIERTYSRQEFRRMTSSEVGRVGYPSRAAESYTDDLLASVDAGAIRARAPRLVLNYGHSPASLIVPSLIGALGVEVIGLNGFIDNADTWRAIDRAAGIEETGRVVAAVGADLGVLMDGGAERIWVVDETGAALDEETTLLLLLREIAAGTDQGALLVPIIETGRVESVVNGASGRVVRTKASLGDLLAAAAAGGAVFAGASRGGYVFPQFLAAYDAVMSTCKTLEVLAHAGGKLSALAADIAPSTRVHDVVHCPWSTKGAAMRMLIESVKGLPVDHLDGVKVFEPDGWVQAIPDPDEPVFHVWAEGATRQDSERLEAKYRDTLRQIVADASTAG
jgi:mannose-1-phosphate guanylyltransferase/phosphomannomutase